MTEIWAIKVGTLTVGHPVERLLRALPLPLAVLHGMAFYGVNFVDSNLFREGLGEIDDPPEQCPNNS